MAEYMSTARRTTVLGTLQAGWSVGYVVATVLAGAIIPVYGWRPLFALAILPVVLALVIRRRMVPEPPGWTRVAGAARAAERRGQWRGLRDPAARRVFLLWTLTSCFLQFGYYGVTNWLPTYLVSELKFDFTKMTGYLVGTYVAMTSARSSPGTSPISSAGAGCDVFGGSAPPFFLPVIVFFQTPGNIVVLLTDVRVSLWRCRTALTPPT